ncbi:MAG: acetyl-CoA carboxylase carboxyltransferase subunit beta, partial [Butyricicoccus porcorum]
MLIDLFPKTRENSRQIKSKAGEKDSPVSVVCKKCGAQLSAAKYGKNLYVCPTCGAHGRLLTRTRIRQIADRDSFHELFGSLQTADPLNFEGYAEKIAALREKTGMNDAVVTGTCRIGGMKTCIGVMDSHFMMASMGSVVGEKLTRLFEYATEHALPVILFTCSGGARMQEGMFSLLQMAKVSGAAARHSEAGGLYITVLTDPTTGGVTA